MNANQTNIARFAGLRHQRGVALIIGLLLLLVLTVLGVAAIKNSTQQERMAAANQKQQQTFEGAESVIRAVMGQVRGQGSTGLPKGDQLSLASAKGIFTETMPTDPNNRVTLAVSKDTTTGSDKITSTAEIWCSGTVAAEGFSFNKFRGYTFQINATAAQTGSGAQANNTQQIYWPGTGGGS